jgi:dienelactone hydrolase
MTADYRHLGVFGDWVAEAHRQRPLWPVAAPGPETQQRVREVLGFVNMPEQPADVRVERTWEADGLVGEEVSWSVGYGPRTHAYVLKPVNAATALPGVVALHDHGGYKFYGKEKIAEGPEPPDPAMVNYRNHYYGSRAYPNALAREGFVVLVHDTFLWGSRHFPVETLPDWIPQTVDATEAIWWNEGTDEYGSPYEVARYNAGAKLQELVLEKFCALLGTTLAGMVSHEDRIAVNYLRSRPDVLSERLGCVGLSGGGCRSALLQATSEAISAAVIVGMMSTYEHLLFEHVDKHTWMFFPTGWARYGDWPDLAACRAPSPLLVQYDLDDDLFSVDGMRAAHERLMGHYAKVGAPERYTGAFYPGPHKFDLEMQKVAFDWLKRWLS